MLARIALSCLLLSGMAGAVSAQGSKEAVKIGVIMPLTGPYGGLGSETLNGARVAADLINEAGGINGRKIELVVFDDKTSPDQSIIHFKNLKSQNVIGVVGSLFSNSAVATAPLAEAAKMPYVSAATADEQINAKSEYVFMAPAPMGSVAEAILQYAKSQNIKKMAVVYDSRNAFTVSGWKHMQEMAPRYDIKFIVSEAMSSSSTDFGGVLSRVRAEASDAIMFWGIGASAIAFTKQFKASGITAQLIMSTAQASKERYIAPTDGAAEGVIVATTLGDIGDILPASPVKKAFDDVSSAYKARFKAGITGFSANGASAMQILAEGVRKGGDNPSAIRDALLDLAIATPYGRYTFKPATHTGLGPDQIAITKVIDGAFSPVPWTAQKLQAATGAK